jgi:hypothetical protein
LLVYQYHPRPHRIFDQHQFIFYFFILKKASLKAGNIVSVVIQMPVTDRSAAAYTRQLQICHAMPDTSSFTLI